MFSAYGCDRKLLYARPSLALFHSRTEILILRSFSFVEIVCACSVELDAQTGLPNSLQSRSGGVSEAEDGSMASPPQPILLNSTVRAAADCLDEHSVWELYWYIDEVSGAVIDGVF